MCLKRLWSQRFVRTAVSHVCFQGSLVSTPSNLLTLPWQEVSGDVSVTDPRLSFVTVTIGRWSPPNLHAANVLITSSHLWRHINMVLEKQIQFNTFTCVFAVPLSETQHFIFRKFTWHTSAHFSCNLSLPAVLVVYTANALAPICFSPTQYDLAPCHNQHAAHLSRSSPYWSIHITGHLHYKLSRPLQSLDKT